MNLYDKIINKKEKISVIGLGYVGMPLTIAFAKKAEVIGFDINAKKICFYKNGIDVTKEVGDKMVNETTAYFTNDENKLKEAKFHIIAVPTPIKKDKTPNLKYIIAASEILARNLTKGSIVVYESTVYPGVTEEICINILEKESGLKHGIDFKVGYSPERINPGDKINRLENIVKIVAGSDNEALDIISKVYELVIDAGIYKAENIKVAEAAKVIENAQRDINIAFMNELSIIFNKLKIDTKSVLKAASTKWNFINFTPGLVGGHCIGVDPYYLVYKAENLGYYPEVILAGRRINDNMGKYVAENTVKNLIKSDKKIKEANIAVMGFTFKENCPDIRNTKVIDIINELKEYGAFVSVVDLICDPQEVLDEYGIKLKNLDEIKNMDCLIFAVMHDVFADTSYEDLKKMCSDKNPVLIDVKGIFDKENAQKNGFKYWRL